MSTRFMFRPYTYLKGNGKVGVLIILYGWLIASLNMIMIIEWYFYNYCNNNSL